MFNSGFVVKIKMSDTHVGRGDCREFAGGFEKHTKEGNTVLGC